MKKLFQGGIITAMLLLQFIALAQTIPPDATQLENIQITNNGNSQTALKIVVQEENGVLNTVSFPQNNRFTSLGSISITDGLFEASTGFSWIIGNSEYANSTVYQVEIDPAGTGNSRTDVIVTNGNTFIKIEGTVSSGEGTSAKPPIPVGVLELTTIQIYEDNFLSPSNPVLGNTYVSKASRGINFYNGSGEAVKPFFDYSEGKRGYVLTNSSLVSVSGLSFSTGINQPITGDVYKFIIDNTNGVTFLANQVSTNLSPFVMESDLEAKDGSVVSFVFDGTNLVFDNYSLSGLDELDYNLTAYVDENGNDDSGTLGSISRPFKTIEKALDELGEFGGIVKIGIGKFESPSKDKIKSNTKFFGSGKPITNSVITYTSETAKPTITSPTSLVGGTILLGKFDGSLKDGIELHNLGVDTGLDWCTAFNSGNADEAIFFAQEFNLSGGLPSQDGLHQLQTNSPPRTGIVLNNVSSLCKDATSLVHSMLIENTIGAKITNVSTYFGTYGLILKSISPSVNGLSANGHEQAGLIIKANDYAYSQKTNVTNVSITSIGSNDTGGVFLLGDTGATVSEANISNVSIDFTTYGFKTSGKIDNLNVSDFVVKNTTGLGFDVAGEIKDLNFSNVVQSYGYGGFYISNVFDNTAKINLTNINASNNTESDLTVEYPTGKVYLKNVFAPLNNLNCDYTGDINGNQVIKGNGKGLTFDNAIGNIEGITHKISGVLHWIFSVGAGNGSKNYNFYNPVKGITNGVNYDTGKAFFNYPTQIQNGVQNDEAVALNQLKTEITIISDTTVALSITGLRKYYGLTGASVLASLPTVAGNEGKYITTANKSGVAGGIFSNDSVSNDIWNGDVATNTVILGTKDVLTFFNDSVHWVLISTN